MKEETYNPISYDNQFFKYLESKGVHPVEYMDYLFEQRRFLIDKLVDSKVITIKDLDKELNQVNPYLEDKLRKI